MPQPPTHALTRLLPDSFPAATVEAPPLMPIDLARAKGQHRSYVEALSALGLTVILLPADESHPDCCFVEDCVLCADGVALVANLGAASRRGEERAVAEALRPYLRLEAMQAPATLDGGDCLRIGKRIFIGQSKRTNAQGLARVREVFGSLGFEVVSVPVAGSLHLKCFCSKVDEDTVLLADRTVSPEIFHGLRVVLVPHEEAYAANCVAVGGTALISQGFPETERALHAAGLRTVALDNSEIRKADGSLTCSSVLF